jgi:hypothetical protein
MNFQFYLKRKKKKYNEALPSFVTVSSTFYNVVFQVKIKCDLLAI